MEFAKSYLKQCIKSEKIEIERLQNKKKQEWEETKLKSWIKLVGELEKTLQLVGEYNE